MRHVRSTGSLPMSLPRASRYKGAGYLTSTVSVILLAITSFKSASEHPVMLVLLILGAATSIAGMGLRWRSHRIGQHEKERIERKAERAEGSARH
jgi:hypothetical protein